MPDREKVIDALTACARGNITCKQSGCPYWGEYDDCIGKMARDTLELLKRQEDGTMFIYDDYYTPMCQKCGFHPFAGYTPTIEWMKDRGYKVCPHCGRTVNWDG